MVIDPEEQRSITEVTERLATQFPQAPPAEVAHLVDKAHHAFDESPIRAFVPVLVERAAKSELRSDT